jgi:hypothetical protein
MHCGASGIDVIDQNNPFILYIGKMVRIVKESVKHFGQPFLSIPFALFFIIVLTDEEIGHKRFSEKLGHQLGHPFGLVKPPLLQALPGQGHSGDEINPIPKIGLKRHTIFN